MRKKMLLSALCLGAMAASAAVTDVVSNSFVTVTDDIATHDDYKAAWTGYGSVTNFADGGSSYEKPGVGLPTGLAAPGTYLSVDGYVTCTAAVTMASKPATVDMMIQIALPDDELALPTSETTSDIQIAVGVETNGTLKVYCKNRSDEPGWYSLGDTPYAEGSWHRVTFTFDYTYNTCLLSLDGSALMSANGYLTSDPENARGTTGAWYKLNTTGKTALASVKVVGSTAIDEVVVKYADAAADVIPEASGTTTDSNDVAVPNSWIQEQGISQSLVSTNAIAPDGSGLTVVQKYQAGLSATDGSKLEIEKMAVDATDSTKCNLTVPTLTPPDGYQNVIEVKTGDTTTRTPITAGSSSVQVELPTASSSSAVKTTYQIKTVTK